MPSSVTYLLPMNNNQHLNYDDHDDADANHSANAPLCPSFPSSIYDQRQIANIASTVVSTNTYSGSLHLHLASQNYHRPQAHQTPPAMYHQQPLPMNTNTFNEHSMFNTVSTTNAQQFNSFHSSMPYNFYQPANHIRSSMFPPPLLINNNSQLCNSNSLQEDYQQRLSASYHTPTTTNSDLLPINNYQSLIFNGVSSTSNASHHSTLPYLPSVQNNDTQRLTSSTPMITNLLPLSIGTTSTACANSNGVSINVGYFTSSSVSSSQMNTAWNNGDLLQIKIRQFPGAVNFPEPEYQNKPGLPISIDISKYANDVNGIEFRYLCSFKCKSSLASHKSASPTLEELEIIDIVHDHNFIGKGAQVKDSRKTGTGTFQRIRFANCRGTRTKRDSQPTCNLRFLWVRADGCIALYVSTHKTCDNVHNLRHCAKCIRTKSPLGANALSETFHSSFHRNDARSLGDAIEEDSIPANSTIDVSTQTGKRKAIRAISNRMARSKKKMRNKSRQHEAGR
jgi:hypothetical protein